MKLECRLSFVAFVLFQLVSTSSTASLSNSAAGADDGVHFPEREINEHENGTSFIKITSYLASSIWQRVSSEVQNGWQKTVAYAKILANDTLNAYYEKASSGAQNSIQQNEKNATSRQNTTQPQIFINKNISPSRNPFTRKFQQQESLSTSTNSTALSEYKCKAFDCMVWKISKVMGISLGGGFLASLALPVAAYIILHIIGVVGYGIAWGCSSCCCQAKNKEGINIVAIENRFSCLMQSIAGSTLKNMYSFCPILLLWLSCGSLIGWFIWPYF